MPTHSPSFALALLALAPAAALAQHHLYTFTPAGQFDHWLTIGAPGDVNRDGYADFAFGVPRGLISNGLVGFVEVRSGRDGRLLRAYQGAVRGDRFGQSIGNAGDVNRDGVTDLVVGVPWERTNTVRLGAARVLSGANGSTLFTLVGAFDGSDYGETVAGIGDVDLDGWPDLAVGAWAGITNQTQSGSVHVHSGRTGAVLHVLGIAKSSAELGRALAAAGDTNGDGHPDVLVGGPGHGRTGAWSGGAYLFSGKDGSLLHTFDGPAENARFGSTVAGVGDVNADGYPDVAAGTYAGTSATGGTGFADIYSGRDGSRLHRILGQQPSYNVGYSIAPAGDYDSDGFADVAITYSGTLVTRPNGGVLVVSGKTGTRLAVYESTVTDGLVGWPMAQVGDVDGDGRPDVVANARRSSTDSSATVLSLHPLALTTDVHEVAIAPPGSQTFQLSAGKAQAGLWFLFVGSASGARPGFRIGSLHVPLNPDGYTDLLLASPFSFLAPFLGLLDASGSAQARFVLPAGLDPSLSGLSLHHAYLVLNLNAQTFAAASNARPVLLR